MPSAKNSNNMKNTPKGKLPVVEKKSPRGRTNVQPGTIKDPADKLSPKATHPKIANTQRAESNRPVSSGAGRHRGDRRDMSPTYTGNRKHAARGNTPRTSAKTRKR